MTIFMQNVLAMSSGGVPVAEKYWLATVSGAGTEGNWGTVIDGSGNVYTTGYTDSAGGAGGNDLLLIKFDNTGSVVWQRSLGGTGSDLAYGLAIDSQNNIIAAGFTNSAASGDDVFVVKYDTNGNVVWQKRIYGAGSANEWASSVCVDGSDNIYVSGENPSNSQDALIIKLNSSGVIQWQKTIGGTAGDGGRGIAADISGNLYVTGNTSSSGGAGGYDAFLIKLDTNGAIVWQKSIGGASNDYGNGISVDSSGNVFIGFYGNSQGAGGNDAFVVKFDSNGNLSWQRSIGGTLEEVYPWVAADGSGGVIVGAATTSQGMGDYDMLLARYDSSGTLQWQRTLGGNQVDNARVYVANSTSFYVVNGGKGILDSANSEIRVTKLPIDGTLVGSYGFFTYKASTLTSSTSTLTVNNRSFSISNTSLSIADTSFTNTTRTLTTYRTSLDTLPAFWINTLGGMGADSAWACAADLSENLYIVGSTASQGAGGSDVVVAKYNKSGVLQWQKTLGGAAADDPGYQISVDSSGNIAVCLKTSSSGAGGRDAGVAKYDTDGNLLWARTIGGSGDERVDGVAIDSSGNVLIAGYTASQGAGGNDALIVKYNSSGTIQWQRSLGGTGNDAFMAVACDSSNNVYAFGTTASQGAGGNDALIVKYNSSGTIQWQRSLGGTGGEQAWGGVVDSSGNVYLAGHTTSQGAGSNDILLAKYDTNGTIQWQRRIGGTTFEEAIGVSVDSAGNVYAVAYTDSQGMGSYDGVIVKYDTSGNLLFQRTLGGNSSDLLLGVAVTASGALFVAGSTSSNGSGGGDALIAKLPADGSLTGSYGNLTYRASTFTAATSTLTDAARTLTDAARTLTDAAATLTSSTATLTSTTQNLVPAPSFWISTLGGSGTDQGRSTVTDSAGNIYVCGSTNSQGAGGYDGLLIKYNSQGAIQWQKTIGNAGADQYLLGVAIDASDNLYTTGYDSQNANDILIAKYNSAGEIQWQRSLGGAGSDACSGVAVDSSSNVYVVGNTASQGAGSIDALIAKYNSSGTIQWQRSLGGTGDDNASAVATDSSGNVYFVGFTTSQGAGGYDLLLAKYNSSGTIQWQRSLGGASTESGNGIAVDSSGNVYITTYTNSQGAGLEDLLLVKYSSSGTIQWQRSLGGAGADRGLCVSTDRLGNIYITGYTASQGEGGNDILVVKYDTNGTLQWQRSIGGSGAEQGLGITVASDGSLIVVGDTASAGAGGTDILVAKLPADGSLTGTYGSFTYAARTLTDAARTLTDSARTLTDSARTLTSSTSTLTDQAATLTANKTTVQ